MQLTLSARPQVLMVWRTTLVLTAAAIAFCSSLFLRPGSLPWWIITCVWGAGFVFSYLFYLPLKQRRLCLEAIEDKLVLSAGVFSSIRRTVPIENIQYIRLRSSLLHRQLGLATMIVVCAGGRIAMPGLCESQAQNLITSIWR